MNSFIKENGLQKLSSRSIAAGFLLACTITAQAQPTGFYLGGSVGHADGDFQSHKISSINHEPSGGVLGIQAGWNAEHGAVLWGIEGDISYSTIDGHDSLTIGSVISDASHEVNTFITLRGRAGVPVGPVWIYGTLGLALADIDTELRVSVKGWTFGRDSDDDWYAGWTAGLGAELPITSRLSLAAEYLYVDMGKEKAHFNIAGVPFTDKGALELDIFRVNLKYFF